MIDGLDVTSVLGNTIHHDETSKFHKHYEGFQDTITSGRTYSLGLLEMAEGDADSLLDTLCKKK